MKINLISCLLTLSVGVSAQEVSVKEVSVKEVLQAVGMQNKELQLLQRQTAVQNLSDRSENNLEDPSVEYVYQWGSPGKIGKATELNVIQSFDFPTLYAKRGQLTRARTVLYEYQYAELRRDVLLRAEELCYDLILVNRKLELLLQRRAEIRELQENYLRYAQEQEINSLESRKLSMEFLNLRAEEVNLRMDRESFLQELAVLNGGVQIDVTASRFPASRLLPTFEVLATEVLDTDVQLRTLDQEKKVADRQISVSRQQNLPSIELGYRRATGLDEEFNGVIMGISVPLFQNRGKVKQARLQRQYAGLQHESVRISTESSLRVKYKEVLLLQDMLDEYADFDPDSDGCKVLKEALDAHEITIIEFFTEYTALNQAYITRLELENRYHKALAGLYKNTL